MKTTAFLCGDIPKVVAILLVVLGSGWWFRILLPVAICIGFTFLFIGAWFVVEYQALTGRIKPVRDLPDRNILSDGQHPAQWNALETQLVKVFMTTPDDGHRAVMLRFAAAINAMNANEQTVPSGLSCIITRKMLYEYQCRIGSLYFERYDERTAMNGPEVLRRLSDDERPRFLEFCRLLDIPSSTTPSTVTPDCAGTTEMARR